MIHYPKIFSFLSILFVLLSCSKPKECSTMPYDTSSVIQPVIHLVDNTPVLYHASFEVLKYHFSGLIAFRKIGENGEIRIALLSEVGLKLMEFKYINHQISNTYCASAITKKSIPRFIGSFLEMLIFKPECKRTCLYREGDKSNYFCRTGSKKVYINTNNKGRLTMECYTSKKKGVISLYTESSELPDEITVAMKYKTSIVLKKVSNAFK